MHRVGGTAIEHRGRGQVAPQASGPQHIDAAGLERADAGLQETRDLLAVESDLVGDPELEQPVQHRPGLRRATQRDAGMGARPVTEAMARLRVGPEQGGLAEVQRVLLVVHLRHEAYRARDQLLLVGLHAQRDPDQLREVAGRALPQRPRLESLGERRAVSDLRSGSWLRWRGAAGHRVDHGLEHVAHQLLRGGGVEVGGVARARQAGDPVGVRPVEQRRPPVRGPARRLELSGSHQLHAEQGRTRQQPHARVHLLLARSPQRPGQHRQGRPHRQRQPASVVAELDHALSRRIGCLERGRTGDGHEAQRQTSTGRGEDTQTLTSRADTSFRPPASPGSTG